MSAGRDYSATESHIPIKADKYRKSIQVWVDPLMPLMGKYCRNSDEDLILPPIGLVCFIVARRTRCTHSGKTLASAGGCWAQTYQRRDDVPHVILTGVNFAIGQYNKALAETLEAIRLNPASGNNYENLAGAYLFLNRLEEAQSTIEAAWAKKLDTSYLHIFAYVLAHFRTDRPAMEQQSAWIIGKPGIEDQLMSWEADIAAYSGLQEKSRELSRRAITSAQNAGENETAASYEANSS
jgi:tetratricopeptide (TPR) repeat protein